MKKNHKTIIQHVYPNENDNYKEVINYLYNELPCCKTCSYQQEGNVVTMEIYNSSEEGMEKYINESCVHFPMCKRIYNMYHTEE